MMHKFRMKVGNVMPSDEVIERRKDFEKLYADYNALEKKESSDVVRMVTSTTFSDSRIRTLKNIAYWTGAAAAAVLLGFFIAKIEIEPNYGPGKNGQLADKQKDNADVQATENNKTNNTEQSLVAQSRISVEYSSFSIDATKGKVLDFKSGTKLSIPSQAFVDKVGNPVEGSIEVRFREMHDPVDFFASGINVDYDSSDSKYYFESAGMVEVIAYKDKEEVFLDESKDLEIELASNYTDNDYNIYYYNNSVANWEYQGKDDNIVTREMLAARIQDIDEQKQEMLTVTIDQPTKPIKPRKTNPNNFAITLDVKPSEFPEIAKYENTRFEVDASVPSDFDPDVMYDQSVPFEDAELIPSDIEGKYLLKLYKGGKVYSQHVYPVFDSGSDYDNAMKQYTAELAKYNKAREANEMAVEAKKEAHKNDFAKFDEQKAKIEERLVRLNTGQTTLFEDGSELAYQKNAGADKAFHIFSVKKFGFWNCASKRELPVGMKLEANFTAWDGKALNPEKVYMVDYASNALYSFEPDQFKNISFNPDSKNIMWTMTDDNKVAVFRSGKFKNVKPKGGSYEFKMEVSNEELASLKSLKKFLDIRLNQAVS